MQQRETKPSNPLDVFILEAEVQHRSGLSPPGLRGFCLTRISSTLFTISWKLSVLVLPLCSCRAKHMFVLQNSARGSGSQGSEPRLLTDGWVPSGRDSQPLCLKRALVFNKTSQRELSRRGLRWRRAKKGFRTNPSYFESSFKLFKSTVCISLPISPFGSYIFPL